jgi:hypothetical protein
MVYDLDIVYSARISTQNAGFGGATAFSGYDLRTDLIFSTAAVPEPSSLALVGAGAACLMGAARRWRARKA